LRPACAPDAFLNGAPFAKLWSGPNRVFFFAEDYMKDAGMPDIDPASVFVFATQGSRVVLTNRQIAGQSAVPAL
jgi:hypothetical protein